MSNIDKRAQKELYAKVEQQAHSLRGSPREYQAVTGMCPVNVIEMQAQKIQVLLDELEAKEKYAKDRDAENEELMLTVGRLRVEREAVEKRIAELEAREVKFPKPISVLHRRDFMDAHRSIYAYPEAEVNAALADAGINIATAGKGERYA